MKPLQLAINTPPQLAVSTPPQLVNVGTSDQVIDGEEQSPQPVIEATPSPNSQVNDVQHSSVHVIDVGTIVFITGVAAAVGAGVGIATLLCLMKINK